MRIVKSQTIIVLTNITVENKLSITCIQWIQMTIIFTNYNNIYKFTSYIDNIRALASIND